jgi:ribosome biogenesis GTPase
MEQGIILSGVGGTYEVQTKNEILLCTLRGRLRLADDRVLVGDRVRVSREGERGVVEEILPRSSELKRPPIANVDQVVAVFAVQDPLPSLILLDRILVHAELASLPSVVVFNKGDLSPEKAEKLQQMYASISYPTLITSAEVGLGLESLADLLSQKISSLVGPSGVGKSSLLNALDPNLELETQTVSAKVQRGRHTTRSVRLLPLAQGYVADTPGFSQLNLGPDQEGELQGAFPDLRSIADYCRFRGCLHRHEPGCAVKEAVQDGQILAHRYKHYLLLLDEAAPRY